VGTAKRANGARRTQGTAHYGADQHQISQVAEMVGVSTATLRLWESFGLVKSRRTSGGYRVYSSEDLKQLTRVQSLRDEGINLAGIQSIFAKERVARGVQKGKPEMSSQALSEDRFIGRHVRQLRLSGKLSITDVARQSGLSASFLSLVERGMSGVSVASLEAICSALGVDVRELVGISSELPRRKVPAKDRRVLPSADSGIKLEELAEGDNLMDCQFFTLAPGRGSEGAYAHEGEEFIFVLGGTLEVTVNQFDRYTLNKGDSLYFKSTAPHTWRNAGKSAAIGIWINVNKAS
jgi:DNA-binding transcriptional MerR regulator/quercetin dioxygenase-like cupin family protein